MTIRLRSTATAGLALAMLLAGPATAQLDKSRRHPPQPAHDWPRQQGVCFPFYEILSNGEKQLVYFEPFNNGHDKIYVPCREINNNGHDKLRSFFVAPAPVTDNGHDRKNGAGS